MKTIATSKPRQDVFSGNDTTPLLSKDEPHPVVVENNQPSTPIIVACEHASNTMPESLNSLGLDKEHLSRHIAYDIGALDIAKILAQRFNATLVHANYSRLVIDLNRHLDSPSCIPIISEDTEIPGNLCITEIDRARRINELFLPYQHKVATLLDDFAARSMVPLFIGIHTFTPKFLGIHRPWHLDIMWHTDGRLAKPLLKSLQRNKDIIVGENEPYAAIHPKGYAFDVHALGRGLPHLFIEVRQDLVIDFIGASHWANLLYDNILPLVNDQDTYKEFSKT